MKALESARASLLNIFTNNEHDILKVDLKETSAKLEEKAMEITQREAECRQNVKLCKISSNVRLWLRRRPVSRGCKSWGERAGRRRSGSTKLLKWRRTSPVSEEQ